MSVAITSYPRITKTADPLEVSRWKGVHQPIEFGFARRDYQVASVSNSGGNALVDLVSDVDPITEIIAGHSVYLNSGNYVGNFTVLSVSSTTITLDTPYVSNSSGGYLNALSARRNYFLQVQVMYVVGIQYTAIGSSENRPSASGAITVDVSSFLQSIAHLRNLLTYDNGEANEAEPGLGQLFNIRYREYWTGNDDEEYSTPAQSNIHYFVNGARQIGQQYGSNYAAFVPFPPDTSSPPAEHSKAKFLGAFSRPTFFNGFPFAIDFIYSENIAPYGTYRVEEFKDVNGNVLDDTDTLLDDKASLKVNALYLSQTWDSDARSLDIWLESDTDEDNLVTYYDDDYVDESFIEAMTVSEYQDIFQNPPTE